MKNMIGKSSSQKMVWAGLLLVVALISFFLVADSGIVQGLNRYSIEALDSKKETVIALTAAAGGSSYVAGLIPGGSGIAQGIMDVVQYLVIVYAGIWAQKYLISITGLLAFKWLYPLACLLFAGSIFVNSDRLKKIAIRITLFATMIFALIPTSIWVSKSIEQTYQTSITETIKQAEDASQIAVSTENTENIENTESKGLWEQFTDGVKQVTDTVTNAVTGTIETFKTTLNNMVDAVAILIVTTCVIPIFVFFFFTWATKLIFQLDVPVPSFTKVTGLTRKRKTIGQGRDD